MWKATQSSWRDGLGGYSSRLDAATTDTLRRLLRSRRPPRSLPSPSALVQIPSACGTCFRCAHRPREGGQGCRSACFDVAQLVALRFASETISSSSVVLNAPPAKTSNERCRRRAQEEGAFRSRSGSRFGWRGEARAFRARRISVEEPCSASGFSSRLSRSPRRHSAASFPPTRFSRSFAASHA